MSHVMQHETHVSGHPHFRYLDRSASTVIHSIPTGIDCLVEVVGDPDQACYEWVIRSPEGIRQHSDDGYGCAEVALRDGLIAYFGLPTHGVPS